VLAVHGSWRMGEERRGPWLTSLRAASEAAPLYARAAIAVHGLFVLNRSETVYFVAHGDDSGAPFDLACDYVLRGRPLPARWWSITAYAGDYLVPNPAGRYAWGATDLALQPDGSFEVVASARPQPGHWLPLGGTGRLTLTLRLYNPEPDADLSTVALPSIERRCP
jgi:hypothetical protein